MFKCKDCKFQIFDFKKECYRCKKDRYDLSKVNDISDFETDCDLYKSRYLEYPITVNHIETPKTAGITKYFLKEECTLVSIRPCAEKYKEETFLGFLLGNIDVGLIVGFNEENGKLTIARDYSPAIFVPKMQKIFYGYESYFKIIEAEEDLKGINKEELKNPLYAKAFDKIFNNVQRGEVK